MWKLKLSKEKIEPAQIQTSQSRDVEILVSTTGGRDNLVPNLAMSVGWFSGICGGNNVENQSAIFLRGNMSELENGVRGEENALKPLFDTHVLGMVAV